MGARQPFFFSDIFLISVPSGVTVCLVPPGGFRCLGDAGDHPRRDFPFRPSQPSRVRHTPYSTTNIPADAEQTQGRHLTRRQCEEMIVGPPYIRTSSGAYDRGPDRVPPVGETPDL